MDYFGIITKSFASIGKDKSVEKEIKKFGFIIALITILGYILYFLLFGITGCSLATMTTIEEGATAVEVAAEVYEKVQDLHKSDAPPSVLNEVKSTLEKAHSIIDKHHKEYK